MAGVRRGAFTCIGWQVTLCDPIWQVTSSSSEMGFPWRVISAFYLLPFIFFTVAPGTDYKCFWHLTFGHLRGGKCPTLVVLELAGRVWSAIDGRDDDACRWMFDAVPRASTCSPGRPPATSLDEQLTETNRQQLTGCRSTNRYKTNLHSVPDAWLFLPCVLDSRRQIYILCCTVSMAEEQVGQLAQFHRPPSWRDGLAHWHATHQHGLESRPCMTILFFTSKFFSTVYSTYRIQKNNIH